MTLGRKPAALNGAGTIWSALTRESKVIEKEGPIALEEKMAH